MTYPRIRPAYWWTAPADPRCSRYSSSGAAKLGARVPERWEVRFALSRLFGSLHHPRLSIRRVRPGHQPAARGCLQLRLDVATLYLNTTYKLGPRPLTSYVGFRTALAVWMRQCMPVEATRHWNTRLL